MAKVEQDVEVEIDIPKSLKLKKTIGKIKYRLHEEEIKLIIDIKKIGKEIKHLQEQLNEANEVIKNYSYPKSELAYKTEEYQAWRTVPTSPEVGIKYLEKWGVK